MKKTIGQGHGVKGRYAGLPKAFCHPKHSKIVILPVAFDKTSTYQRGSEKGPSALIEASRNMELYDIETDSEIYLKGIYTAPTILATTSKSMLQKTYVAADNYLNQNQFVVTLGGEHSISYAAIRAYSEHFPNLTVLQFDAHADLQDAYENNPLSHASVMARVAELSHVEKIVSVGIRSMSGEEKKNLSKVRTFFAHEIAGSTFWIKQLLNELSSPLYITFDLDVFDSSLMPSTGTPEPGGLDWNTVMQILKQVTEKKRLVGFDVVELCPQPTNHAPDYLAAKLIYKLLSYHFRKVK